MILNESKTDLLNKYHYIFYTPQFFYESGLIISFIIITLFFFFLVTYFLRLIIKRKFINLNKYNLKFLIPYLIIIPLIGHYLYFR